MLTRPMEFRVGMPAETGIRGYEMDSNFVRWWQMVQRKRLQKRRHNRQHQLQRTKQHGGGGGGVGGGCSSVCETRVATVDTVEAEIQQERGDENQQARSPRCTLHTKLRKVSDRMPQNRRIIVTTSSQ